ncbi:hypothetical protein ABW20_dc0105400 [Dactylellina cionopaga]|nr:hypothetical protein ABW20_dc0105400 [Dactylellina cionopaga]
MSFKAPLMSPLPLNDIQRRILLDSTFKMFSHQKAYIRRYAVRLLAEPRPLSHIFDISQALLKDEEQDYQDSYSAIAFQTRCIPLMKILGHQYLDVDTSIRMAAKYITDEVLPQPIYNVHLIVRSIISFDRYRTVDGNGVADWANEYTTMLRFFIHIAKVSSGSMNVISEESVVYWMIKFVELVCDSWYPELKDKRQVFDAILELLGLYKITHYFLDKYDKNSDPKNLDDLNRVICVNYKKTGRCKGQEDDSCYFAHRETALVKKHLNNNDAKAHSMDQWLHFGAVNNVFRAPDLKLYWDQALEFFNGGQQKFVIEALSLRQGLLHISQVMQLHRAQEPPLDFSLVQSFMMIFSDPQLEDANTDTKEGSVAAMAKVCADCADFFSVWTEYIQDSLAKTPSSKHYLKVAKLLVGVARFTLNFNPTQKIERLVKKVMMTLCEIIAENNDEGTSSMNDAHTIAERLQFLIKRNLIDGTIDMVDRDLPDVGTVDLFEEPLIFDDSDEITDEM